MDRSSPVVKVRETLNASRKWREFPPFGRREGSNYIKIRFLFGQIRCARLRGGPFVRRELNTSGASVIRFRSQTRAIARGFFVSAGRVARTIRVESRESSLRTAIERISA